MSKAMSIGVVFALAWLLAVGCEDKSMEEKFFDQPLANRVERLRQYSLSDQYKIFRYGTDKREPPLLDLATPISERGAEAVPFLLDQLKSKPDDITVRDIVLLFQTMAADKSYDVKSDSALMTTLASRVSGMNDQGWKESCQKWLQLIKDPR